MEASTSSTIHQQSSPNSNTNIDPTPNPKKGRPRKRGLGSRTRAAEKYRDYNNHIVMGKLQVIRDLAFQNLDNLKANYDFLDVTTRARRFVCNRDYEGLALLTLELKTAIFEARIELATESEVEYIFDRAPEFFEEPVVFEHVHYLSPEKLQTITILEPNYERATVEQASATLSSGTQLTTQQCDQVTCVTCEPLSYDVELEVQEPLGLCLYAGPGTGKTHLISKLPIEYRSVVYDTDHYKGPVAPRSILITNRPDVFVKYQGAKIAIISSRKTWLDRCRVKCGHRVKDQWYSDVLKCIYNCFVIVSDKYLSELVDLRGKGPRRGRPPRRRNRAYNMLKARQKV